jgi:hypothetical protein
MNKAITVLMMFWICTCAVIRGQSAMAAVQPAVQLHVQPGDSLTNLFGNDWREVYQLNQCECRFASEINDANDPNFIIAGSSLTVPTDVHLTERALDRIGFAKSERDNLRSRLDALMQAGGDIASSSERLHAQLDGAISIADLPTFDKATADLEGAEVQEANRAWQEASEAKYYVQVTIAAAVLAVIVTILLAWALRSRANSGSRRLKAALKMMDTVAQ